MKLNSKTFFAASIITLSLGVRAKSFDEQKTCFNYEPDSVSLDGIAYSQVFPGPPNYEDTSEGDEVDKQWLLKLEKKICVDGSGKDDTNQESERDVKIIQLVITKKEFWDALHKNEGLKIKVRGTLYHAFTAHHRTNVLFTVKSIERTGKNRNR